MAKAFLIRWGYEQDFKDIKLQTREPGFAIDTEKFFIGTGDKNIHIPNEDFVSAMIKDGVLKYTPITGTSQELSSIQENGTIAFNTDTKRLQYKTMSGNIIQQVLPTDIPSYTPTSVVVSAENIDVSDNNSVTLAGITKPLKMFFLNGVLCTTNQNDPHMITIDNSANTVKIKECAENDIISYF